MSTKERVDLLLVRQGFFETREKAKAAVMAGLVYYGTERIEKPGTKMDSQLEFTVKGAVHPYVSRGGLKLEKALREFSVSVEDKVILDIGASTGGFTDCALQHGARFVYAIDVGYNQLDWSLRNDRRVHVMERTNFRYLSKEQLSEEEPVMAVIDVSFISLKLILPVLKLLLNGERTVIALIKPQFEAGREQVGKSGVVRDSRVHEQVLQEVITFATGIGFELRGLSFSPITGGEGNIEFLVYWQIKSEAEAPQHHSNIIQTVAAAHQILI
jgi:23S rRNA (cytidine1920-2'-O)/16S rRNA (cytidine1409-2'-O)-methyltransferase